MNDHHPEPAEIAALGAELLSPSEEERLREHLADCASCAQIESDLTLLGQELGEMPDPPIPSDVAERIDAALAAEAAGTTASFHVKQHRWPLLGLAAAGALIAVGLGAAVLQGVDTSSGSADDAAVAESQVDRGGAGAAGDADDTLESQVRRLLTESEAVESAEPFDSYEETTTTSAPDSAPDSGDAAVSLPSCVRSAIDRTESPLAAGEETYDGEDAYLVVLPHAVDPEQVDAYVVAADCVTAEPAGQGEILAQASYPRE